MSLQIVNHEAELTGELEFSTVLTWRIPGFHYIDRCSSEAIFDFTQVTKMDSAGVALLIEWWRAASNAKKKIHFKNLPAKAKALIALSDLTEILGVGH